MKLRDIYSNKVLVAGLCLLILGLGNWIVGATEGARYQGLVYRNAQTGGEENHAFFRQLDQQKNEEVLHRITEDREKYNAARVKLDFFNVVLSGGQLFFFAGLFLSGFGIMRSLRQGGFSTPKMVQLAKHAFKGRG